MAVLAPPMPYGYLWEIFFAAILVVSWVLAVKFLSFGRRWIVILFVVGIGEMVFSANTRGYSSLVGGLVIGLVTAYSGFIIPALYMAKLPLRKKQTKIAVILSGCLELIFGYVGIVTAFNFGVDPFLLYFGLLTIGFYSLIVGAASLFFTKTKI
ncbi:MAG: hypothetical protein ABSA79_11215 [Candidatus Bathyarchaeia archaeon]